MAQFVLKIEKLSHIMGTVPIVELARAFGLHPRLWLPLVILTSNFPYILKYPVAIKQSTVSSVETVQMKARAKSLPVPRKKVSLDPDVSELSILTMLSNSVGRTHVIFCR